MVDVVTSLARWRELAGQLRAGGASIGLTMTMGALHGGHVALLERSREECDASLATIFVNPRQFEDADDFERYPADLAADVAVCAAADVTAVLAPSVAEMWPSWPAPTATTVHVAGLTDALEGAGRPGHFDGVASVVTKLLVATGECTAYFGEKDFQQLCVVRRAVEDLGLEASIVGCATVREADGLALSSRNARLSAPGRHAARVLHAALVQGRSSIERGDDHSHAESVMRHVVAEEPAVELAYAAVVEPATLRAPSHGVPCGEVRLLIAARIDGVRLIDNLAARGPAQR